VTHGSSSSVLVESCGLLFCFVSTDRWLRFGLVAMAIAASSFSFVPVPKTEFERPDRKNPA
jgi:hypothetical protein